MVYGSVKEIKADTTSPDTIQIEKGKAPNFPNDEDEGLEYTDDKVSKDALKLILKIRLF